MTREVIHSGNVRHMSRDELEDHCAYLGLVFLDGDSGQELRDAIMAELAERGNREESEG